MKSVGESLKTAREEQAISMDQAVNETNISRHYLEALENEAFDIFPAEAYLLGFLRNYAGFLGLDPDKVITQFKNFKIGEEPTPIDQLVGTSGKKRTRKAILLSVLFFVLLAGTGFYGIPRAIAFFSTLNEARQKRLEAAAALSPKKTIRPTIPLWEGEVHPEDVLILQTASEELKITISKENNRMRFHSEDKGTWSILLGEEIYIPGDNGLASWRIYLKDMGLPNDGGIIEVQKLSQTAGEEEDSAPPSGEAERFRETKIVLNAPAEAPFSFTVTFEGPCLFRYQIGPLESQENYYAAGETLSLNVSEDMTIWVSNAGAAQAKINGQSVSLGTRGEVVVSRIRWVEDSETASYNLSISPLY